jgi:hypothetical protein
MGAFDITNDLVPWLYGAGIGVAILLWISWIVSIGAVRGTLAILCRVGWLIPLFLAFMPETLTKEVPRSMALRPLHILVDDSVSMKTEFDGERASVKTNDLLEDINKLCRSNGCLPRVTLLSSQDKKTSEGFTPLSEVVEPWLYKVGNEKWMVISDGGDWRPESEWDQKLAGAGLEVAEKTTNQPRAMIVGFKSSDKNNIWIESYNVAPFSFENKPLQLDVQLARASTDQGSERVQVQILTGDQALATVNAEFKEGETTAPLSVTIPALSKGRHLLFVRALPTAAETTLWDNSTYTEVEVMPNTVGILHLLGSPSWDGRFLRRYLKAEPKYDLISFFILRDPWDSQQVNERELSLIPFPVERLFREELPNFRVVIIQNFTLFQFLLPEYQANLVKFVKDGGGVLFLGGPRALQSSDLKSSPLREILPFEVPAKVGAANPFAMMRRNKKQVKDPNGPAYDPETKFSVELAKPEGHKRALANVYDDWENLGPALESWKNAKGLHHMERVKFKEDVTTNLLYANTESGKKVPLAVASYPGKGRALWLFSDSMWRLGMTPSEEAPRRAYNQFMQSAMTWLMRQNLKKPLIARSLRLSSGGTDTTDWTVTIKGPASKYFRTSSDWLITVCGQKIEPENIIVKKSGSDELILSGSANTRLAGGQKCRFQLKGNHEAFGSVATQVTGIYPKVYHDNEVGRSPQKLVKLAQLTGARITLPPEDTLEAVRRWIEDGSENMGIALPSRFKTHREFYWMLEKQWYWLLLLLIPLEVVIRRWDQFSSKSSA